MADIPTPYDESEVETRGTPFMLASRPPKLGPDTSAADADGVARRGHHESVGERQGRQPAQERPAAKRQDFPKGGTVDALFVEIGKQRVLIDLARLLLTPGARLNNEDDRGMDEWVKARIYWHRLDGNGDLADKLLHEENSVREALGKELLDV